MLARNAYLLAFIIVNIIQPRMLNQTDWNLGAKSGFFWAGTGLFCIIWTYFRLPETQGRSFGALDILFEQKVHARKFKSTNVDEFASHTQAHHLVTEKDGSIDKVDLPTTTTTTDLNYK